MPAERTFNVKLIPAEIGPGTITFQVFDPNAIQHTVTAATLASMQTKVRDLAREFGQTCAVHISLPRGERKPAGFDRACKEIESIKFEPVA